jgi:hypothetical protein
MEAKLLLEKNSVSNLQVLVQRIISNEVPIARVAQEYRKVRDAISLLTATLQRFSPLPFAEPGLMNYLDRQTYLQYRVRWTKPHWQKTARAAQT